MLELPVSINNVSDQTEYVRTQECHRKGKKSMEPTCSVGAAHPHRCRVRDGHIGYNIWFSVCLGPKQGSDARPVDLSDGFSSLDGIDLGREAQDVVAGSTLNRRGRSSGNENEK